MCRISGHTTSCIKLVLPKYSVFMLPLVWTTTSFSIHVDLGVCFVLVLFMIIIFISNQMKHLSIYNLFCAHHEQSTVIIDLIGSVEFILIIESTTKLKYYAVTYNTSLVSLK